MIFRSPGFKNFLFVVAPITIFFATIALLARIPVSQFEKVRTDSLPNVYVLDENGKSTSSDAPFEVQDWSAIPHPQKPNERLRLHGRDLIRLKGEPAKYLFIQSTADRTSHRWHLFFTTLISIVVSVLLATGLSFYILFYSMRKKAELVDSVISELQKGNLRARFPINKLDETGQAMLRFNRMAEEIERLVEQLKSTEQARMSLLQELAHDLRTPVASLKNLLETQDSLPPDVASSLRDELMGHSMREVEYLERLVEDLLFLARVSEPRYRASTQEVTLSDLIEEEVDVVSVQQRVNERGIQVSKKLEISELKCPGDPHLLKRLLRNALDNACSFAKNEVLVRVRKTDSENIEITVSDDGPGLSDEALEMFGKRRITRISDTVQSGRLSVGLGSVIMKAITHLHRGEVTIANRSNPNGAELRITLPLRFV